jgi:hypothetical protein
MPRVGGIFPACGVPAQSYVFRPPARPPDGVGSEQHTTFLSAGRAVAQANSNRLPLRFDPDSAAVAARGTSTAGSYKYVPTVDGATDAQPTNVIHIVK